MNTKPIGVFDSGLGGLTAVRELNRVLPHEDIVYFGDTGRVPYGSRSPETIVKYARQDIAFLLSQNVKAVVAACGTVSTVAPHVGDGLALPFTGVVLPAARAAVEATKNRRIGVIGTTATVRSGAYTRAILAIQPLAQVFEQDCPLFVPLVENGFLQEEEITKLAAQKYLSFFDGKDIDTLILGCTHYPLLKEVIASVMGSHVTLIDTGAVTANHLARLLREKDLLNPGEHTGQCRFFVSDQTQSFCETASLFLCRDVDQDVQMVPIDTF